MSNFEGVGAVHRIDGNFLPGLVEAYTSAVPMKLPFVGSAGRPGVMTVPLTVVV